VKPEVDRMLEVSAIALLTRLGPALPTAYEKSTAGALGALLLALREEFERGAARRVEENAAMRAIFARACSIVEDPSLAGRLRAACEAEPIDLAISALEAENARLRGLLIELHAHSESLGAPDASALVDEIWRELARSTERRKLAMAMF
jgi:hypothetical protein